MQLSSVVTLGIFVLCLSFGRADEEQKDAEGFKPKFPANIAETKTFKKFIELVDESKLNITVFISNGENHKKHNLKRLVALGVTFITNRDHVVETGDSPKQKVHDLMKIAEGEKLSAGGTRHVRGDKIKSVTNNPHGMVRPKGYEIQLGLTNGKTGIQVDDEDNVAAHYTFLTPDSKTTKVLYARAKVETVETSHMEDDEIRMIERVLPVSYFMYEEDDVPKAVATVMDTLAPKSNWQVIDTADKSSHLDATKWGIFKMADNEYTVFSI